LQSRLHKQNLLYSLSRSLQGGERAGVHYIAEHYGPEECSKLFAGNDPPSWFSRVAFRLAPRGWKYRALMLYDEPMREFQEAIDLAAQRIDPLRVQAAFNKVECTVNQWPCGMLAAVAIPNFQKAWLTTARTQTIVNMAAVVCALERYKAEHGAYPAALDGIAPALAGGTLPHDLVTGKSFQYVLATSGKFSLYTSGYDGKDDAGRIDSNPANGDWCWVN
jgi:Tfp pilus assembly protein PilE